jgi:type II secretory pathway component PulF
MSDHRLLAFSRALADAIRSGLPMVETLRNLSRVSFRDRKLRAAAELVSQGKTLHESLGAQGLFPPILIALIRAGEESGKTDAFLDRFSAALETRIDFSRRLNRALVYPAFTGLLAGAIFLAFSTKAAPMLLQPIIDAGVTVPAGAQKIMRVGEFILLNWPLLLGAVLACASLLWAAARSSPGRKVRALAGHWLPGARYACEEARHYQFEATLELLLGAGLRPRQIMEILTQYFQDDPLLYRRLSRGAVLLAQGKGFTESLAPCLPPDDRARAAVAETAGRLDETLGKLAVEHRERHMHRLKMAASAVQIGAVVALAPVCFALIMCILWPTFSMLRSAGSQMSGLGASLPEGGPSGTFSPLQLEKPVRTETKAAARFNETNAKNILGFMQTHKPRGEDAEDGEKKKPMMTPKLKSSSMQRLQFKRIEATKVKSSLD